nr:hypothetical protein [Tanacetum cinerariifolium]
MAASVIPISSDSSDESVSSHVPQVILFGTILTSIPVIPVVHAEVLIAPADPLVAPEVGAFSVISPTGVLDLVDDSTSFDPDPSEDSLPRPERHESLTPSSKFPFAPVVSSPPEIHRRSTILVRPGKAIPFGRPYRTHPNMSRKLLTARKRVGPFPARRLSWRCISQRSSDRHSSPESTSNSYSSSSSSDSSSDTSSGSSVDSLSDSSSVYSSGCDTSGQSHSGPSTRVVSPRLVYLPVRTPQCSEAFMRWRSAPLSTLYPLTTSESSLDSCFERLLDSSLLSTGPSRKRCRSPTTLVKRFIPSEARGEEHMEIGIADVEAVADLGISDIREDEEEFEAEASAEGMMEITVDPLVTGGISESTGGDAPDLEGTLYDIAHSMSEWLYLVLNLTMCNVLGCKTMTNTRSGMTPAAIEEMINQRVAKALETRKANRNIRLGNSNDESGNGSSDGNRNKGGNGIGNHHENDRGAMHVVRECTYQDFMKCQPLNIKGMKGVVGLIRFQELTMLCTKMVPEEEDRVEKFIRGDVNPIRTLEDYSRPSHEGYRNTIELPKGNNVVPLRSNTIRRCLEMGLNESRSDGIKVKLQHRQDPLIKSSETYHLNSIRFCIGFIVDHEQKIQEHKRTILHPQEVSLEEKVRRFGVLDNGMHQMHHDNLSRCTIYSGDVIDWEFLANQGLEQAFFESINTNSFFDPQWVKLFLINEHVYRELVREFFASFEFEASTSLYNGIYVWPVARAVREDDEAKEEARGEASNEGARGKATTHDRLRLPMLQLLLGMVTSNNVDFADLIRVNDMYQPWRTFLTMITNNVDFVDLIWEELKYQIESMRSSWLSLEELHQSKLEAKVYSPRKGFTLMWTEEAHRESEEERVDHSKKLKGLETLSKAAKFKLNIIRARKDSRHDFFIQQRPKGSNDGSSITLEVPDELVFKSSNEGASVTLEVPDEPIIEKAVNAKIVDAEKDTEDQVTKEQVAKKQIVEPEVQSLMDILVTQEKPVEPKPSLVDTTVTLIPDTTTISPIQPPPTQLKRRKVKRILNTSKSPDTQIKSGELECRVTRFEKKVHAMSSFNLPEAIDKFVKAHLKNVLPKDVPPKDVPDFGKIKMEKATKKSTPKCSSTPFDPTAITIYDQKDTLFQMMSEARAYDRHPAHKALYDVVSLSLSVDKDNMDL